MPLETLKKTLKKLAIAFTIAALPFSSSMTGASPAVIERNPEGVWKTMDGSEMMADISRCADDTSRLCATIYRTSAEPIEQVMKRAESGQPPSTPRKKATPEHCSFFKETRIFKKSKDQWQSDRIPLYGVFNAKVDIDFVLSIVVRMKADVSVGSVPFMSFYSNAQKISPESDEFKPCKTIKEERAQSRPDIPKPLS